MVDEYEATIELSMRAGDNLGDAEELMEDLAQYGAAAAASLGGRLEVIITVLVNSLDQATTTPTRC